MFDSEIICDECNSPRCQVKEITPTKKLTMQRFKEKHSSVRRSAQVRAAIEARTPRVFRIKCGDCGHTITFTDEPVEASYFERKRSSKAYEASQKKLDELDMEELEKKNKGKGKP